MCIHYRSTEGAILQETKEKGQKFNMRPTKLKEIEDSKQKVYQGDVNIRFTKIKNGKEQRVDR